MEDPHNLECGDPTVALQLEAEDVGKDIGECVSEVLLSEKLSRSALSVFINIETKEKVRYCVELSRCGYRVVGREYDMADLNDEQYYETVYMMLDSLSPMYRLSFADCLASKLAEVARENTANAAENVEAS